MKKIKIIIADDKQKFRDALKDLLTKSPIKFIAEAGNGLELLEILKEKVPDVILLDLEMPVMDGNQTFDEIRTKYPLQKVIILSMFCQYELIENYRQRGASGYLSKENIDVSSLTDAIIKVFKGDAFVHDAIPSTFHFNEKEKTLMPLVFNNYTNEEIATKLNITTRTVEKQRKGLYIKVGGKSAIDFYKVAFIKGLQFLGIRKGK